MSQVIMKSMKMQFGRFAECFWWLSFVKHLGPS